MADLGRRAQRGRALISGFEGLEGGTDSTLFLGIGIACAAASGFGYNLGIAVQKRAARTLPEVRGASASVGRAFLQHRGWLVGGGLIGLGWVMRLVALLFTSIAVAVPVSTAFIALQAWFAHRWFGEALRGREWFGTGACILGIALIAFSLDPSHDVSSRTVRIETLLAALAGLIVLSALALLAAKRSPHLAEIALSASAGLLYAGTGTLTKVLGVVVVQERYGLAVLTGLAMAGFAAAATVLIQAAHQRGRSMVMVPVMNVLADGVPIALSGVVFGEAWPAGLPSVLRALAMAAILVGIWALTRAERVE